MQSPPLLEGATGLFGGKCQGANGRLESPRCPLCTPEPVRSRRFHGASGTRAVWLVTPAPPHAPLSPSPPMYQWHRWPNLKAPLEATQQGQVITVVPFKESSSPQRLPLSADKP